MRLLSLFLFDCSLTGQNLVESFSVELLSAVKGVKTVLFLEDVGKLSVAECTHLGVLKQNVDQTLEALVEFFHILRCFAVAPVVAALFGDIPEDTAHFGNEVGLSLVLFLLSVVHEHGAFALFQRNVSFLHRLGILIVVVYVVDIGDHVNVSRGVDDGTVGIDGSGDVINVSEGVFSSSGGGLV